MKGVHIGAGFFAQLHAEAWLFHGVGRAARVEVADGKTTSLASSRCTKSNRADGCAHPHA